MRRIETDVCIIGAGSGGLSVAAGCAQMGARTVLLESGLMGGDCLNYGCVPSKSLLAAAHRAQTMREPGLGIAPVEPQVDYAAVMDHVRQVIAAIAPIDSQQRFEGLGVHVIREHGRFVSPTEVQAGNTVIAARRFVIATGSSPLVPDIDGLKDVPHLTNETLFDLRERPRHLLIAGGGPIGLEMAQAHRRLGCDVTVIEGAQALGKDDPEAAAIVLDAVRAEGVRIVEGAPIRRVRGHAGDITVETEKASFSGTHLLVALGRSLNIDGLDLHLAGIAHDRGIEVDDRLRARGNRRVYAVGDAAGRMQFTHVAGYHGGLAVREIALGLPARVRQDHIPWVTYTDPELAQVGLTEAQARDRHGDRLTVIRVPYADSDRAQASGDTRGLVKVMVARGKPVGATIAGAQAGELIGMWAMAIADGRRMTALTGTVLPYPTLSELNKKAAGAYFSPKLFDSPIVKRVVGLVQRYLP
ncbi:pyridine nucleotide oxidoreductase [Oceaniovalibus guishaninsula JLT2003]|uniref:Pyridine nucleotide oxidoreductase n=1 Tax=Oceaniovalibus guishaninsula JLT2003 TaxID=1231392 RepID=K2GKZ4_9RHOB|nr:FAD-dependent oxidoreductase [Oceaniovalibus guishaninsula]EKE43441.1 pyridine nucleotide oxidoreductase [Oceaniovalibus guishaninsula JLT2003]